MIQLSGYEVNLALLLVFCLSTGFITGAIGIGGGFILTPALIMLGIPAHQAVGTVLAWAAANSLLVLLTHRRRGNVDLKLGLTLALATVLGIEIGVRLLNRIANTASANLFVLCLLLALLLLVSGYILNEFRRRKRDLDLALLKEGKLPPALPASGFANRVQRLYLPPVIHFGHSGIRVSAWVLLLSGVIVGTLAGFSGTGGGFITVPVLVYVIGLQPLTAVGTVAVQVVTATSYGALRHGLSGNVVPLLLLVMLAASIPAAQFSARVTGYLRGITIRLLLALTTLVGAIGISVKVAQQQPDAALPALLTLSGLLLVIALVLICYCYGRRYRHGMRIPRWAQSLVSHEPETPPASADSSESNF